MEIIRCETIECNCRKFNHQTWKLFKYFPLSGDFIWFDVPKCASSSIRALLRCEHIILGGIRATDSDITKLDKLLLSDCFKFGFVRNPYDRIISTWMMYKNSNIEQLDELGHLSDCTFKDFLRFALNYQNHHWELQARFLSGADFIGRLESIDTDFAIVSETIGIKNNLPMLNRSDRLEYSCYYDVETKTAVARMFEEDLDTFKYVFGE